MDLLKLSTACSLLLAGIATAAPDLGGPAATADRRKESGFYDPEEEKPDTPSDPAKLRPHFLDEFFDPEDGYLDFSKILERPFGFFPMVTPITEPAVGTGAAFAPIFIKMPEDGKGRPDIYAAGAMSTSNGSEGIFGSFSNYLRDDRWHVFGGAADMSINLDFHGLGSVTTVSGDPLRYNLEITGGLIGADRRLGNSPWRAGLRYLYADVAPSLASPLDLSTVLPPSFERRFGPFDFSTTISSLQPTLSYDTRDNIFTPTKGVFTELAFTANMEILGGSQDYQVVDWTGIIYHPLVEDRLFLGWRADLAQSFGDVPFYRRPFIHLRGAPSARYQGAGVASTEVELRWQFQPRWSVLAFGGAGITWPEDDRIFGKTESTLTGGVGFRYLIARQHGIHAGIDLAYDREEGSALYIQFGSGWFRP